MQHAAEGPHLARGLGGSGHEGAALLLGEVEAAAFGVVKLHARPGLIETVHMNSVSRRAQQRHGAGGIIPEQAAFRRDPARPVLIHYEPFCSKTFAPIAVAMRP